jgi:glycosyltransferase involved in cell wall biosynthesis
MFPIKPISVIYNVPHLIKNHQTPSHEPIYDLCFEGFLSFERGMKQLFQITKEYREEIEDFKLLILGEVTVGENFEWAMSFIKENELQSNIIFSGWQPYENLYSFHRQSKIGIYLYQYCQ